MRKGRHHKPLASILVDPSIEALRATSEAVREVTSDVKTHGGLLEAFGGFVMGGNFVIGIIVFAILVIVNFMVITKGSGRIAEVSARFTLDAMPINCTMCSKPPTSHDGTLYSCAFKSQSPRSDQHVSWVLLESVGILQPKTTLRW